MDNIHQAAKLQPAHHVFFYPHNLVRDCIQGHEVPAAADIWDLPRRVSLAVYATARVTG